MSRKTILMAAGGTGGHLYPAQALAKELAEKNNEIDVHFIGGGLKTNRCFDAAYFSYKEICVEPLLSKNPLKSIKGIYSLSKAIRESSGFFDEIQPDLFIGFGSYHSIAPLLVAKWKKCPIILHEANCVPGRANRWLGFLADRVGLHFPDAVPYFGAKAVEVPLPIRASQQKKPSKNEALSHYNFNPELRTLLIFGGSQGAEAINHLCLKMAPLLKELPIQILHFTGHEGTVEPLQKAYTAASIPAIVKSFEKEMVFAWSAADFFIGRAGASTIAEATHFKVPGLLIPYPFAHQHQENNGHFFENVIKGGESLKQSDLTSAKLAERICFFLEKNRLEKFKESLIAYDSRSTQRQFVDLVNSFLEGSHK